MKKKQMKNIGHQNQKKRFVEKKMSGEDSLKIKYVKIMKNKTPG